MVAEEEEYQILQFHLLSLSVTSIMLNGQL